MTDNRLLYAQLHLGDFLRQTDLLDSEPRGFYACLLIAYFVNGGPLPDHDETLARALHVSVGRFRQVRPVLAQLFVIHDGAWHHPASDEFITKTTIRSTKRSRAANARWHPTETANGNAHAYPSARPNGHARASPRADGILNPDEGLHRRPIESGRKVLSQNKEALEGLNPEATDPDDYFN